MTNFPVILDENDRCVSAPDLLRSDMEKTSLDVDSSATLINDEKGDGPPEGGFGWVIVVVAFSVQFLLLGTINNFAILYIKLMEEFNSDKQETSWVGSITYGIMFLSGPIATSLCEKMGARPVAVIGGIIAAIATFLASFSTSILKLYLTEGFLFGVGASLCYFPSMLILPQYFRKKWSLVTGFVTCGSGIGTMALGPVLNGLTKYLGWRKTLRVTSVSMVVVALISFMYRPRIVKKSSSNDSIQKQKRPMFEFRVLKNKAYLAFVVALFVFMLSYQVPFVHLMPMAIEYGVTSDNAALLAGIISIFSTAGRLLFGHVADSPRINRLYMYQIAFLGIGVANTLCTVLKTFYGLIAYCALFGFFEGCYVCQVPILTGDIVGPDSMGSGVGILFGIKSIPLTLGPPIAGALYNVSLSYELAFYVAGALSIVTACIMFAIPFLMPYEGEPTTYHSTSKLYSPPSCESVHNNNEYERRHSKDDLSQCHLSPSHALSKQHGQHLKRQSLISIHHLHTDLGKKISMRDIGSLSSFGSMVWSPSSRKSSMTARPHAHTLTDDRVTNL